MLAVPAPAQSGGHDVVYTGTGRAFYSRFGAGWSPEENRLDHSVDELAKKLGDAKSDEERSKIKTQLSEILENQFDLRQKRHLEEIKALEAKVKKLKDLVEKRQENRRGIVAKRLDLILSDAEGLGW
jgi:hypothetical protein